MALPTRFGFTTLVEELGGGQRGGVIDGDGGGVMVEGVVLVDDARPNHAGRRCGGGEVAAGTLVVALADEETTWAVLFDLQGGHQVDFSQEPEFKSRAEDWEVVLSSNEARFGGTSKSGLSLPLLQASFTAPETIVLCRKERCRYLKIGR